MAAVILISPNQMLRRGLRAIGVDGHQRNKWCKETQVTKFKSIYGKHPLHCSRIWRDLQTTTNPDAKIDATEPDALLGFFCGLNFLKTYAKENIRSALFEHINVKKLRELCWYYVDRIAALREEKIKWPEDHEWDTIFIASVDGTHAFTNEPRDPNVRKNPKWYSHKDNNPGINYEIALHLWTQQVIWAKSWDPASVHDLTVFRMELVHKIPAGKLVIADKGYICKHLDHVLSTWSPLDSQELRQFKKEARARHENFNKRLKDWGVLNQTFTHGVHKHQRCFDAVLVMTQYAIEDTGPHGEPLNIL
jgi:hypothetical protein